jgi:hypothetical protein
MNQLENESYLNNIYDTFNDARGALILELKNDKDCTKEKVLNAKIQCVDNMMKNILKYRNINAKQKLKQDL